VLLLASSRCANPNLTRCVAKPSVNPPGAQPDYRRHLKNMIEQKCLAKPSVWFVMRDAANSSVKLRDSWTKVHKIFIRCKGVIDGVNLRILLQYAHLLCRA